MILYLSGQMSGKKDLNRPLFYRTAKKLRVAGHIVINPPELDKREPKQDWNSCLKRDLKWVVSLADGIATLPNWKKSRGANLEVYVAKAVGIPVHTYQYYLKRKI